MKKIFMAFLLIMEMFTTSVQAETNTTEVENFVGRFYTEVLGRTADTAGLADWTNRLVSGESTGADVAFGFVFSDEFISSASFKNNEVFLTILYKSFFNRDADTDGLNGWLQELEDGTSKEDVLNGFLYSTEFANLCEAYGIKAVPDDVSLSTGGSVEDFVKRFYSVVLAREADAGGLSDWVNRLNTKVATGADIATGFVFSDEFDEASKDDVTYLNVLYKAFFNRDADEGGLKGWLDQLEQGVSREEVLNGFLHSQEFISLCEGYGILAFTGAPIYRVLEVKNNTSVFGYMFDEMDFNSEWYVSTTTTFTYDTSGNILTASWVPETGRSGKITYTYDSKGKRTNTDLLYSCGANSHIRYTYDANGNLEILDYSDNGGYEFSIIYTYDANGNRLTSVFDTGESYTYTYDVNGNRLTLLYSFESETRSDYYKLQLVDSISLPEGTSTTITAIYTYDENGNRLKSITNNFENYIYTYDVNGNLLTLSEIIGLTYNYDVNGNLLTLTENIGSSYTYVNKYDEQGHLISIHKDGELVLSQTWGTVN